MLLRYFLLFEYPMSCRSRAWEGAPSPRQGRFVLFCYIHLPLVASDGVYILDNNPPVLCSAQNTELIPISFKCSKLDVE